MMSGITKMKEGFLKIKVKTLKLESYGNRYFPNVFSKALAAKTYLVSQFQHLNAKIKDIQKHITKYVNNEIINKSPTHFLNLLIVEPLLHIYILNIFQLSWH